MSAFAYPIDVTKKIDGVQVDYTASAQLTVQPVVPSIQVLAHAQVVLLGKPVDRKSVV